ARLETTRDERLGAGGNESRLVDLVAKQGFVVTAALFLETHDVLIVRSGAIERLAAAKMNVEQQIISPAPLGRRRQRCQSCAMNVVKTPWSQQLDRRQERAGLLGRDGKAVDAQERGEGDENERRARQTNFIAHTAASAIRASSRPEMNVRSSSSLIA